MAINSRIVIWSLGIKYKLTQIDIQTILLITEKPIMQSFPELDEFCQEPLFPLSFFIK